MILLVLSVLVIGLLVFWFKKKISYWENHGFKFAKPEFPFGSLKGVGYKLRFSQKTLPYYEEYKKKAKAIGLYFFTSPVAFITDLDTVKDVLVKDFSNFHSRGTYVNTKVDPLTGHLFNIEGTEWKNMRAKLTPTFTSGKMKMMFETLVNISDEMIDHLKANESFDIEMKDILSRFTTDIIGNVAFGLDVNSIKNPNTMFRQMGRKVFETTSMRLLKIFFITTFRETSMKLGLRFNDKDVSDFFLSSIRDTVEYREKNDIKRNDFLSLLLQIKNHGKIGDDDVSEAMGKLTLEELAAQSFLFFIAGFETSSSTMTFALYELALNPDVQETLREEIRSTLSNYDNQLTYEAMLDMKYLQMVIDETLRKYPIVDTLLRIASQDYRISNTDLVIEKGTLAVIPVYAIHFDEEIYPESNKFDPERFTNENKNNRHPMAYLPFGEGPRNCIGLRFGLMQTKIGLIKLLTNFKFSPTDKTTIPMELLPNTPVLSPAHNMWLKVEKKLPLKNIMSLKISCEREYFV